MYFLFESILGKIILFLIGISLLLVISFLYSFTYWWRKGLFHLKPRIPFGNFTGNLTGKENMTITCAKIYEEIKSKGQKYAGVYFLHFPIFFPTDPAIIKRILATDFEYFSDRGTHFNPDKDPLGENLFALPTDRWRLLRTKLTPTFTSGKMKSMFDIMHLCAKEIVEVTEKVLDKPVEINDLVVKYTVNNIGRVVFGIECNALHDPEDGFKKSADRLIRPPWFNGIKLLMALMSPSVIKYGNLRVMEKSLTEFFLNIVEQNIKYRESNNIRRNDFFQLLLDMKHADEKLDDDSKMKMTPKLMTAQAFVFFVAGFETSSTTVSLCLFELSKNLDIQDKLREEIKMVNKKHGGKLTYDGLKDMVYFDQCVQETLRKYPSLGFLNRDCVKDYKIPGSDFILEKGTKVMISLQGLQNDPEYFSNPDKFDPDRFSPENKDNIKPYTHIPFGEGHRICIGMRFGLLQTKVCLAAMLENFEFTLNPMTKCPLAYIPQSFTIAFQDGIHMNVKKV